MANGERVIIGVDPGVGGGIAVMYVKSGQILLKATPETDEEIWHYISSYSPLLTKLPTIAMVEKVAGFVGGKGNPGARMFTFGESYGAVRMALLAADVQTHEILSVTPRIWQEEIGIIKPKGTAYPKWKSMLCRKARELFPDLHITLKTCDALLIAEFARRTY